MIVALVKLYTIMFLNEGTVLLQNKLDVLHKWSNTWQINISTSVDCSDLYLNNIAISSVKEFKDLSVVIDENLKFTSHIKSPKLNTNLQNNFLVLSILTHLPFF